MSKLNWAKSNRRDLMRDRGSEGARGGDYRPGLSGSARGRQIEITDHRSTARRGAITVPIKFAAIRKNRKGDEIQVALRNYDGSDLIDIRSWWPAADGEMRPGKGFACGIRHLPALTRAMNAALAKAVELGLVDDAGE